MSIMAAVSASLNPLLLSLCFNGHFPDGSGSAGARTHPFWILLELRMTVTTGAIRRANLQIVTTNKWAVNFLQAGCLFCRPTNSVKTLKELFHCLSSYGKCILRCFSCDYWAVKLQMNCSSYFNCHSLCVCCCVLAGKYQELPCCRYWRSRPWTWPIWNLVSSRGYCQNITVI